MWKIEVIDDYSPGWTLVVKYVNNGYSGMTYTNDFNGALTANLMGINQEFFIDTLIIKYNAFLYRNIILYFYKIEDFQSALEWIEAGILSNMLNKSI